MVVPPRMGVCVRLGVVAVSVGAGVRLSGRVLKLVFVWNGDEDEKMLLLLLLLLKVELFPNKEGVVEVFGNVIVAAGVVD